jgi:NAD(P)H-hydrate epimerase
MGGAVALAARAALRAGAGLVSAAVPAGIHAIVAGHVPEVMCRPVPDSHGAMGPDSGRAIEQAMERCDAVCVGPGLSLAPPAQHAARWLIGQCPLPLVVDADALTAISGALAGTPLRRSAATVLTPHPGECARLLGSSVADVQSDRIGAAREVAKRYGAVVVLKGARTVIAEPAQGEGRTAIITTGNPGMATAGAGDVLTGVVGCLLAQGMGPYEAACLGAFVHGRAGDEAAQRLGECGLLASDIADALPRAIGMTRMPDPSAEVTSDA